MPLASVESIAYPSASTAFGSAAAPAVADAFDYEAEILKAWEMFPEIKDRVYFVDIPSNKAVYPGSRLMQHGINNWLRQSEDIQSYVALYSNERKSSVCLSYDDGKRIIMLYTAENPDSTWNRIMPLAQSTAFTFDHELAHAVIADASGAVNPNLAECIADAYAAIRHFQRFGADSKGVDGMVAMRATRFVFADKDNDRGLVHFTSPVLEQILARRHDVEWDKLTPEQTVGLARRFGLMYAPHPILLQHMDEKFRECHTGPTSVPEGNTSGLAKLVDILEGATFPAYIKWGAMALEFFRKEAETLTGKQDARLRIADKAKLLENMDDILSGLGEAVRKPFLPRNDIKVIANQP